MEAQFKYIINLAKQYKLFNENPTELYKTLNAIPKDIVEEILKEYGDMNSKFQPLNFLRSEIARNILNGIEISEKLVDEIKDKIRSKDVSYFNHIPKAFLKELEDYSIGKRDLFANWKKPWSIFHTFIYRDKERETTQLYLNQISKQLIEDLELRDYKIHWVDFYGSNNFGSDICWIALFPIQQEAHWEAYQFFVSLSAVAETGRYAGSFLPESSPNIIKKADNYSKVLSILKGMKSDITSLNKQIRNYFKYSPGSQASEWNNVYSAGIAAVSYRDLVPFDISELSSREELNEKVGFQSDNLSNKTWNLWLFKSAKINDVVFANKGTNTCIGIGIVQGDYYFDKEAEDYRHRRKVNWITNKIYKYKANTLKNYKTIFRPDTFTPTRVWQFLLNEYVRLYPELADLFEQHNLTFSADSKPTIISGDVEGDEPKELNFWWLNANPSIWSISSYNEGETQKYTARNERGNKRRIYRHFQAVQPGDLMIGYESSPVKQVKALFEITKGLHQTEDQQESIEFQLLEKLEIPVHWNELQNDTGLSDCEVFINNQGSLFKLTEDEFDIIRDTIDNKNILQEKKLTGNKVIPYSFSEDKDKPFLSSNEFQKAVSLLRRKKNIILQGPPGVGKTFIARKLAYAMMGNANDAQIDMVQFHQSYSYEDFIQGLRPGKRGFELRNGIFYTFCKLVIAHPDRNFFFIIDEINRGNLSKIFGELMMLIEVDKRGENYAIKLTYAEDAEDTFYVPDNLYIIGTMNTADRSLAIVDYALRRRFVFVNLQPIYDQNFRSFLISKGVSDKLIDHICSSVEKVNNIITDDSNLGNGFQIGHSYFCSFADNLDENHWYDDVLSYEIIPLLEEIWFDDLDKVKELIEILRK